MKATEQTHFASKKSLIVLFIVSMVLLISLSTGTILYSIFLTNTMEHNIKYRLLAVSKMASQLTTSDELEKYQTVEDMNLPSYKELRHALLDFSREYDVRYVYYLRRSGDHQVQYIVDNDFDEETRVGLDTPPYDIQSLSSIKLALEGKANQSNLGDYTPGWEGLLTAFTPLFDKDGNVNTIVGVDILDGLIVFARRMFTILIIFQIIVVAAVFITGFITLLHYRAEAQKAIEAASAKTIFFSNMSHEFRTPLNIILGMRELVHRTDDINLIQNYTNEIGKAGESLLSMVDRLIEYSFSFKDVSY